MWDIVCLSPPSCLHAHELCGRKEGKGGERDKTFPSLAANGLIRDGRTDGPDRGSAAPFAD